MARSPADCPRLITTGHERESEGEVIDEKETTAKLESLLREAGYDPARPDVKGIKTIVSGYYAGRTAEVLKRVNEVHSRFTIDNDNRD